MNRSCVLAMLVTCFISVTAHAQSSRIITGEGISGDVDKKRRSPTVSVSTINGESSVKILVDAYVADKEYEKYPIQFDFYINRMFFTSQLRSQELPGPIGIDVGRDRASLPFNYSIVARTLHPNREFTSVINGAVFDTDLTTPETFDCTLTTSVNSEDSIEYVANAVTLQQTGNSSLSISFETDSTPEGHSVVLDGTITIDDEQASASLTITEDEGEETSVSLSGEAETAEDGQISSITLNSEDSDVALSCS